MASIRHKSRNTFSATSNNSEPQSKKCSRVFDITLYKHNKKWSVDGDQTLLQLERKVHQAARLQGKSRLRIEANEWLDSPHFNPPPLGWIVGSGNNLNDPYGIQCLKKYIIDACLCPLNKLPTGAQDLEVIRLKARNNIGLTVLKQNSNSIRIKNVINDLEKVQCTLINS